MSRTAPDTLLAELATSVAIPRFDRSRVAEAVRPYYRLSNLRGALALLWCWAWIIAAFVAARLCDHWAVYVLCFVVIAGRQVALFFLIHEAAHHRVFASRLWSDRIKAFTCSYPLGVYVDSYRHHHLQHHRNLNTKTDPDWLFHQDDFWQWPRTRRRMLAAFSQSIVGFNSKKWLGVFQLSPWARYADLPRFDRASWLVFLLLMAATLWFAHASLLFLGLWILPMFTLTFWLHQLRTIAEHLAIAGTDELNATRTVVSSPLERFLVAPMGVNFHLEHHLFPGIPAYHLAKVHRLLMQDEQYKARAHITPSYLGPTSGLLAEIAQVRD